MSDDGIDSLRPRLREVCEWIDAARQEGGKVLIHCRVGVSRSATVTVSISRRGRVSAIWSADSRPRLHM